MAQPAPAATPVTAKPGPHALKLVNGGRSAISAVYVAPPDSLDWSDDLLGKQVAAPGKTVTLSIKDPSGACVFDLQFLMNNGDTVEKKAVNVCDQPSYAFTP
ncbi:MAG: hypothetical protein WDM92_05570 [Caulobacteraceae bacterium]